MLIQHHWNKWKNYNFWLVGLPLGLLIFLFTVWSNVLLLNHQRTNQTLLTIWETTIIVLASYFTILSITVYLKMRCTFQHTFKNHDIQYLTIDFMVMQLSPLFILAVFIFAHVKGKDNLNEGFWVLNGFASLFIWMRLVSYLQVNERLSFIIGMIYQCFTEMAEFLIILMIGVFAFTDGFKNIR